MSSNASGIWLALAAASAAVAVAAGAFAAHGLAWRGAQAVEWMRTGSQYQMWHALATVAAAALARRTGAGEGTGWARPVRSVPVGSSGRETPPLSSSPPLGRPCRRAARRTRAITTRWYSRGVYAPRAYSSR